MNLDHFRAMGIGFCRDCEHWKVDAPALMGECELTYMGATTQPFPESKATATSWCGDGSILRTDPDFGCVQFKAKEAP